MTLSDKEREYQREYKRRTYARDREKRSIRGKAYRLAHGDEIKAKRAAYRAANAKRILLQQRTRTFRLRVEVIEAYGGHCRCCGEDNPCFLTIDHVQPLHQQRLRGTDYEHGGSALYSKLKKSGYPPGYQVLCFNCNCAKKEYSECPHHLSPDPVTAIQMQTLIAYYRGMGRKRGISLSRGDHMKDVGLLPQ